MSMRIVQSDLNILCSSTYTTVCIDSVSGQRRPRSACANAQADLSLRCSQIDQVPFSCVAYHVKLFEESQCKSEIPMCSSF